MANDENVASDWPSPRSTRFGLLVLVLTTCACGIVIGTVGRLMGLGKPAAQVPITLASGNVGALFPDLSRFVEEEMEKWNRGNDPAHAPSDKHLAITLDIVGEWWASHYIEGTSLSIRRSDGETLDIAFSTGGSLAHWNLQRTGEFVRGIVKLSRPVKEYYPITYDTLYAVQVNGEDYLVPSPLVKDFESQISRKGKSTDAAAFPESYAFRRRLEVAKN